jgi:hypothetical protein
MQEEDRTCRICYDTEPKESLIFPCLCTGTMKWIHKQCLKLQRNDTRSKFSLDQEKAFFASNHCPVCQAEYTQVSLFKKKKYYEHLPKFPDDEHINFKQHGAVPIDPPDQSWWFNFSIFLVWMGYITISICAEFKKISDYPSIYSALGFTLFLYSVGTMIGTIKMGYFSRLYEAFPMAIQTVTWPAIMMSFMKTPWEKWLMWTLLMLWGFILGCLAYDACLSDLPRGKFFTLVFRLPRMQSFGQKADTQRRNIVIVFFSTLITLVSFWNFKLMHSKTPPEFVLVFATYFLEVAFIFLIPVFFACIITMVFAPMVKDFKMVLGVENVRESKYFQALEPWVKKSLAAIKHEPRFLTEYFRIFRGQISVLVCYMRMLQFSLLPNLWFAAGSLVLLVWNLMLVFMRLAFEIHVVYHSIILVFNAISVIIVFEALTQLMKVHNYRSVTQKKFDSQRVSPMQWNIVFHEDV